MAQDLHQTHVGKLKMPVLGPRALPELETLWVGMNPGFCIPKQLPLCFLHWRELEKGAPPETTCLGKGVAL